MKPSLQQEILKAYFTSEGLNYSVCRVSFFFSKCAQFLTYLIFQKKKKVHIESCDFCLKSYSFDDVPDDFRLKNFNISHDKQWLIPYIQAALKTSPYPIKIYASPWSPPAWMKSNGQMDGSSYPGLKPQAEYHQAWALFFSNFLSSYAAEGINIWGITVQNGFFFFE